MKYVLYLVAVVSLLGARGCPSGRSSSASAVVLAESTAEQQRFAPSSQKGDGQVIIAKVLARAESPQFQAVVAKSLGISSETVGNVVLRRKMDTRLIEVRAELADRELAAKLANAVAAGLAEDFRNNPDVRVSVVSYARELVPEEEEK